MKHFFISPHFDDAIGSCGATIRQLRTRGEHVIVHTVFAGVPSPPFSQFADELHALWGCGDAPVALRRREDAEACRTLDCLTRYSDVPEALYRRSPQGKQLYPDAETLFGPAAEFEDDLHSLISREFINGLSKRQTKIYAPLGIGHHVDHVVTFRIGLECMWRGYEVCFYQEFYYTDWECQHLKGLQFQPVPRFASARDLEWKLKAFCCYSSQIPMLFGDLARTAAYFTGNGRQMGDKSPFQERFWVLECMDGRDPRQSKETALSCATTPHRACESLH